MLQYERVYSLIRALSALYCDLKPSCLHIGALCLESVIGLKTED